MDSIISILEELWPAIITVLTGVSTIINILLNRRITKERKKNMIISNNAKTTKLGPAVDKRDADLVEEKEGELISMLESMNQQLADMVARCDHCLAKARAIMNLLNEDKKERF